MLFVPGFRFQRARGRGRARGRCPYFNFAQ